MAITKSIITLAKITFSKLSLEILASFKKKS